MKYVICKRANIFFSSTVKYIFQVHLYGIKPFPPGFLGGGGGGWRVIFLQRSH